MKKILALVVSLVLALGVLAGCSGNNQTNSKLKAIVTISPVYDWVKNIVGDSSGVELSLLADSGVDMHSFQPTAKNITDISACDVFIYVGGESDEWVEDVLKEAVNKEMVAVNLLDALGSDAKAEELVEGMQGEEGGEEELDEHIWLSLKNADKLCGVIADKLGAKDKDNQKLYQDNAAAYCKKLQKLDGEYAQACKAAKYDTLIFADRFPFRYLTEDYKLKYYAAFSGCSAESEASFKTLAFLAGIHPIDVYGADGYQWKLPTSENLTFHTMSLRKPVDLPFGRLTAILSTHDVEDTDEHCLHFILERDGKTVFYGPDGAWFCARTWSRISGRSSL